MDHKYFTALPAPIQAMVNEVESLVGSEIAIRQRVPEEDALFPDKSLAYCDCYMLNGVTTVTIIKPVGTMAVHYLIHEILHAHRNIALAVLRLTSASGDNEVANHTACYVDNDIEHLYIIPAEIEYAPEARTYWENHYFQKIQELSIAVQNPRRSAIDNVNLKNSLLRHWLVTSCTLSGWPARERLRTFLELTGFASEADILISDFNLQRQDKARFVGVLLRALQIDREQYLLTRFVVSEGISEICLIPAQ
jgi:hypothetical protein